MNLYKFGVKIFASNPDSVNVRDFIPVFHGWIRQQKITGHQLIDVHDSRFSAAGKIGVWTKADSRTQFDDLTATPLTP